MTRWYKRDRLILDLDDVTFVQLKGTNTNNRGSHNVFLSIGTCKGVFELPLPFTQAQHDAIHGNGFPDDRPSYPGEKPRRKLFESGSSYERRVAQWNTSYVKYYAEMEAYDKARDVYFKRFYAETEKAALEVFQAFLDETGLDV